MSSFLKRSWSRLSYISDSRFITTYEDFIDDFGTASESIMDNLSPDERDIYSKLFSNCQRRYLAIKEKEAYEEILAALEGCAVSAVKDICKGFARDAYERVNDLINVIDTDACHQFVMVGSGAFPATLFWLHDHHPEAHYTGLDIDARCVEMATKLKSALGIKQMDFKLMDGKDYDFDGANFVYIANQVIPKKEVLKQVTRSRSVARVVVREPTRKGELLAEAVRSDLPREYVIAGKGPTSPIFLSYDLFLTRV